MAKPVIWSEEALHDIESIAKYISRDSVYYAQMVVERIIGVGAAVNVYPESGRLVPELEDEHIREKFIYRANCKTLSKSTVLTPTYHKVKAILFWAAGFPFLNKLGKLT